MGTLEELAREVIEKEKIQPNSDDVGAISVLTRDYQSEEEKSKIRANGLSQSGNGINKYNKKTKRRLLRPKKRGSKKI